MCLLFFCSGEIITPPHTGIREKCTNNLKIATSKHKHLSHFELHSNQILLNILRNLSYVFFSFQVYIYLCFFERNILYPLLFLSAITEDSPKIAEQYGALAGSFIVVICGLKCLRSSYSDQSSQYLILVFSVLFFKYDYKFRREPFFMQYFFVSIIFHKFYELLLKVSKLNILIKPIFIIIFVAVTICGNIYCPLANNLGVSFPCICTAVFSTTFGYVVSSSIGICCSFHPTKSFFRKCNLHNFLCQTCKILGKGL